LRVFAFFASLRETKIFVFFVFFVAFVRVGFLTKLTKPTKITALQLHPPKTASRRRITFLLTQRVRSK
jgi:hypothetical protein